jgi:hypothetical protein
MTTDPMQGSAHPAQMNPPRRRWAQNQLERKASSRLNTLAASAPNRRVVVDEIVFGSVKDLCRDLGIQEGTPLVSRGDDGAGSVCAECEEGNTILLPRDYALFVWVRDA